MSLRELLAPSHMLQATALALSIFSLVAFLWLALTVWLNGDRRAWIARLGVVGLSLSALFFFIHAELISNLLLPYTDISKLPFLDFLWHLLWLPALGVPYIWFAIGLHYASLINVRWQRRRPFLLITSVLLGCSVLFLLIFNQATATFVGTLRLLSYGSLPNGATAGGVPMASLILLPLLFLCYVTFCAIGPWFTPRRISRLLKVLWHACIGTLAPLGSFISRFLGGGAQPPAGVWRQESLGGSQSPEISLPSLRSALADAFWDDPTDVELLEEPILSWHLARPGLLLGALLMVGLTTILGVMVIRSMINWPAISPPLLTVGAPLAETLPFNLIVLDLIATTAVAFIILLIGYSVVRHGVLIERPLARRGFLEQWRGIVIVATAIAIFITLLVTLTHSSLGGLLLITSLATVAYALFTWSSYTAHDRYIALLGPFLRSAGLRHWLHTDLQKTELGLEELFSHLCQDVLAVQCARLTVMAGPLRRSFNYCWPVDALPVSESLSPSHGPLVVAHDHDPLPDTSFGKPKGVPRGEAPMRGIGGAPQAPFFSPAAAGGRRENRNAHRLRMTLDGRSVICWILPIYDERGHKATLYLGPRLDGGVFTDEDMDLAHACGQRILDTLGDHEAMQAVSGLLRRRIMDVKLLGAQQRRVLHDEILPQMHLALLQLESQRSLTSDTAFDEPISMISDAHRRLAAMMRATPSGAPYRLERDGMMRAIRTMLEQDFQHAFDEVEWCISDETAACVDELTPPAIAELIFAAVQEALRNAARHARGSDVHRHLCLTFKASCDPHLEVIVADDGVGIVAANSSTSGTGGGLLTHSALLAIAGGSLTIKSVPDEGVTVRIVLPVEALR